MSCLSSNDLGGFPEYYYHWTETWRCTNQHEFQSFGSNLIFNSMYLGRIPRWWKMPRLNQLVNQAITEVLEEQPLALPRSAKYCLVSAWLNQSKNKFPMRETPNLLTDPISSTSWLGILSSFSSLSSSSSSSRSPRSATWLILPTGCCLVDPADGLLPGWSYEWAAAWLTLPQSEG